MEHPVYGKYFIMKEIGHLPDSVIKNQMVAHKRSISGETVIGTFPTKPTMRKAADYKFSINQEELSEKEE